VSVKILLRSKGEIKTLSNERKHKEIIVRIYIVKNAKRKYFLARRK
jgi:hypothetical protein